MAKNKDGEPEKTGFPFVSELAPVEVPKVAGIDNAKLKVFLDYAGYLAKVEEAKAAEGTAEGAGDDA